MARRTLPRPRFAASFVVTVAASCVHPSPEPQASASASAGSHTAPATKTSAPIEPTVTLGTEPTGAQPPLATGFLGDPSTGRTFAPNPPPPHMNPPPAPDGAPSFPHPPMNPPPPHPPLPQTTVNPPPPQPPTMNPPPPRPVNPPHIEPPTTTNPPPPPQPDPEFSRPEHLQPAPDARHVIRRGNECYYVPPTRPCRPPIHCNPPPMRQVLCPPRRR
jgi:hypothetical protein